MTTLPNNRLKEPFSAVSHFVAALLALGGTIVLLIAAHGRLLDSLALLVYGLSMVALYMASAVYHALDVAPKIANRLMRLDHIGIYLLIAGSYTPMCLITMRGPVGYGILAAEYTLAAVGIALSICWKTAPDWVRVTMYLAMGWVLAFAIGPMRAAVPSEGIAWIVAGGLCYTVGCAIFALDRPHIWPGKFSAHDLWHLFVIAGSTCMYIPILKYVALVGVR
ncbi:MAG TPA: hemolysin III family protein [Capsulimonadaceae bacterium]|jgi:hemolysin III